MKKRYVGIIMSMIYVCRCYMRNVKEQTFQETAKIATSHILKLQVYMPGCMWAPTWFFVISFVQEVCVCVCVCVFVQVCSCVAVPAAIN